MAYGYVGFVGGVRAGIVAGAIRGASYILSINLWDFEKRWMITQRAVM